MDTGTPVRRRFPARSAEIAVSMAPSADSSSPRSVAISACTAARSVLTGLLSRACEGRSSKVAVASSSRPCRMRMKAMSTANRSGAEPISRQAATTGSGGAARLITSCRQPPIAASRCCSGSVSSSPAAPGCARKPQSGSATCLGRRSNRPATVAQRSFIAPEPGLPYP